MHRYNVKNDVAKSKLLKNIETRAQFLFFQASSLRLVQVAFILGLQQAA
jgi:hypothetical protein